MFHSLLWSEADAIINEHDPVQILNHTYIFYKLGQTRMTHPVDQDETTQFQPWYTHHNDYIHQVNDCILAWLYLSMTDVSI